MLSAVLSEGRSSRLYSRMVDREQLALTAQPEPEHQLDPGEFLFVVRPRAGVDVTTTEKVLFEEIEKMRAAEIPAEELRKAKNQLLTNFYREIKTISGRANQLGTAEISWADTRRCRNPEQVRVGYRGGCDACGKGLSCAKTADCCYAHSGGDQVRRLAAFLVCAYAAIAQVRLPQYTRQVLSNGAVLDVMPRKDVPLVTFRVTFKGGAEAEPAGFSGLANVTAEGIRRGTAKRTSEQFSRELDSLGAIFTSNADLQSINIHAEFLSARISTKGSICCWMRFYIPRSRKPR